MTEIILFKQNFIENGKFANINDYGWILTPNSGSDYPWVKLDGSLSKVPNVSGGNIRQDFILTEGVQYRLKFTMANRTAGIIRFQCASVNYDPPQVLAGATFLLPTINQSYDITFTSDGNSLLISMANTFDGTLYNFSLTEIIEQSTLDGVSDIPIPLSFNIDDILNLGTRKTTFSKSIVAPFTPVNNLAFDHIYKINSESVFNPNLKSRVTLKRDGITGLDAILCLDGVNQNITNGETTGNYSFSVYGESLQIFDRLGSTTIKELDFSMYDHEFTIGRIQASWVNDIKLNGSYGAINRDQSYISPAIVSMTSIAFADLIVNYNQTAYIELTFASSHTFEVGDNVFIDCDVRQIFGDQQVIGIDTNKIIIAVPKYWVGADPSINGTVWKYDYLGLGYWYPMCDYGKYQVTTNPSTLVVGRGYYIYQVQSPDDFTNVGAPNNLNGTFFIATGTTPTSFVNPPLPDGTGTILYQLDPNMETLERKDSFINHWVATDFIPHIFVYEILIKMFAMLDIQYDCPTFETQAFRKLIMPCDAKFNLRDVVKSGTLLIGKEYMIYNYVSGDNFTNVGGTNTSGTIFVATATTPTNWTNGSIIAEMCNMNQWLPGMKLSDFFLSILNMFNLVIIEDVEDKALIHIVNRGDFFSNSVIDWSDKLITEEPLKITLANKILPTYYELKYKDSSDFFNIDYNNDFGNTTNSFGVPQRIDRNYGDQPIFLNNDFATKENKIEISFEPTILAGPIQPVVNLGTLISEGIYADSDKNISVCYYADANGSNIARNSANRILIATIKNTNTQWSLNSEGDPTQDNNDVTQGTYNIRYYPFAGHTDQFSSACILFGPPLANYSTVVTPTKRSLYSQYWQKYLAELTNVNSKIITCSVKLSIIDIYSLDFSKLYKIDDFTMKLNKITDWDLNGDGRCKAEFLLKNL